MVESIVAVCGGEQRCAAVIMPCRQTRPYLAGAYVIRVVLYMGLAHCICHHGCSGAALRLRGGGRPCKNQTREWPGVGKIAEDVAGQGEGIRLALEILNLTLADMARGQETGLCGVEIPERECMVCGTMNVRLGVTWQGITQVGVCDFWSAGLSVGRSVRRVCLYLSRNIKQSGSRMYHLFAFSDVYT